MGSFRDLTSRCDTLTPSRNYKLAFCTRMTGVHTGAMEVSARRRESRTKKRGVCTCRIEMCTSKLQPRDSGVPEHNSKASTLNSKELRRNRMTVGFNAGHLRCSPQIIAVNFRQSLRKKKRPPFQTASFPHRRKANSNLAASD